MKYFGIAIHSSNEKLNMPTLCIFPNQAQTKCNRYPIIMFPCMDPHRDTQLFHAGAREGNAQHFTDDDYDTTHNAIHMDR